MTILGLAGLSLISLCDAMQQRQQPLSMRAFSYFGVRRGTRIMHGALLMHCRCSKETTNSFFLFCVSIFVYDWVYTRTRTFVLSIKTCEMGKRRSWKRLRERFVPWLSQRMIWVRFLVPARRLLLSGDVASVWCCIIFCVIQRQAFLEIIVFPCETLLSQEWSIFVFVVFPYMRFYHVWILVLCPHDW